MAKAYEDGSGWAFRLRVQGQDIYRGGFKSQKAAQEEADGLARDLRKSDKQESCEKLFYLSATAADLQTSPPMALQGNVQRQLEATLSRALELNDRFFQQERDKLEAWAEDRIASAEQALKDTKLKLKGLKRQARMALSMEDAQRLQQDIRKTEAEQRRQRQDIFAVEDEIEARRDALIAALQRRLHRASRNQSLFVLRWSVV